MIPTGQSFRCSALSRRRTTSPSLRFSRSCCHFLRHCRVGSYSFFQRTQNWSARYWIHFHCFLYRSLGQKLSNWKHSTDWLVFIVSRVAGVSGIGSSGSGDTGTKGLEFMTDITFAISVVSTSWVKRLTSRRWESRIRRATPIILSHTPPMWEEWGGLNIQLIPFSDRYSLIGRSLYLSPWHSNPWRIRRN